ncbi:MAG: cytochrome P450, partial [Acidimicrobiales bacterium]|nr:cytochrome P450 [Acidimicrobiales bacterium]
MTDFFVDPHAALAEARAAGPVLDDGIGGVVLRYEDVRATLADPARFREAFIDALRLGGVTSGAFHDWMAISPLDRDGDEHKAWRAVMARTFTPRQVEAMRPAIAARCQELIDTFPMGEPFDVVAAFAQRLPLDALCALVGVPDGDRDDFRVWADTIGLGFDILGAGQRIDEIDAALEQLLAYTTELVALRTAEPADDLVSRIAEAAVSGAFTQQEAVSSVAGLVFAGHETTRNQLGTTWVLLATTAGAWDDVA